MEQCRLGGGLHKTASRKYQEQSLGVVPIHPFVDECLKQVEKEGEDRVFRVMENRLINFLAISRGSGRMPKKVGLEDFHFHDSRHYFNQQPRLAQNDYFRIMAISG